MRLTAHQYDSFSPALSLREKCCTSRYEVWVCGQRAVHGIQIGFTWVVSSGWHSSSTHKLESGRKPAPRGFSDSLLEFLYSISLRKFFSVELQRRLHTLTVESICARRSRGGARSQSLKNCLKSCYMITTQMLTKILILF